ncbi:hypothetical protein KEU06_02665 [Pseudaminobacter sp. 19-2017]|uniref:Secreted protein n=1 Tax=Pseudaminobacter soli (ex Zhang et al. 2022) TaxID=2831468 RepID=A0A942DY14_9HYPH|nr:hypothetical protein [Pseudaminobacter soli]MBS3647528.1 hypothetical protein [Pseudaminobacter soli]
MKALCVTTLFFALAASAPAFAQAADAARHPQDCLARPGQNPGTQAAPEAKANQGEQQSSDSETLSSKLDPCNGVLRPPPVGDQMATPAPDQGKTPVIRPDEIEPQTAVPK